MRRCVSLTGLLDGGVPGRGRSGRRGDAGIGVRLTASFREGPDHGVAA